MIDQEIVNYIDDKFKALQKFFVHHMHQTEHAHMVEFNKLTTYVQDIDFSSYIQLLSAAEKQEQKERFEKIESDLQKVEKLCQALSCIKFRRWLGEETYDPEGVFVKKILVKE